MVSVQEKLSAHEFTMTTGLSPERIREAGKVATEKGYRYLTSTISETSVGSSYIDYVIKGIGGMRTQMTFRVSWREVDGGQRQVRLAIDEYLTTRPTAAGFIPIGPKSAPARVSFERFSGSLQSELSGVRA